MSTAANNMSSQVKMSIDAGGEIRVIFAELIRKREAVLLHDRAALWAGEEGGEGARGLFLLSSLYDPQALVQGFV